MKKRMPTARFAPGTVIRHRRFGYRGLIFDVDAEYSQSEEWYEMMADSQPAKDRPWYHILVDGEMHTTYVPEDNLICCFETDAFEHPLLPHLFDHQAPDQGQFQTRYVVN